MEPSTQPQAAAPEITPPQSNLQENPAVVPDIANNAIPVAEEVGVGAASESKKTMPTRILNWLLGASTPVGKVMRPVLRWTALVEGLLAIGLLVGFFLLYTPTQQKLDNALNSLAATNAVLDQANSDLASAKQTALDLRKNLANAQTLQYVYQLKDSVSTVRLDLVNKQGPKAKSDLATAQKALDELVKLVQGTAQTEAVNRIATRMTLVADEYAVDAAQAQKDLETIYTQLGEIEKTLLANQ